MIPLGSNAAHKMILATLQTGHEFGPYEFSISEEQASTYKSTTSESFSVDIFEDDVHPLHIDALTLARLISHLRIVEERIETIHAGQQMTVHRTVHPNETVIAHPILKSNALRRGSRWASFQTSYMGTQGDTIAESVSTIILLPDSQPISR